MPMTPEQTSEFYRLLEQYEEDIKEFEEACIHGSDSYIATCRTGKHASRRSLEQFAHDLADKK